MFRNKFQKLVRPALAALVFCAAIPAVLASEVTTLEKTPGATPRNVIFILTDDHRFDAMSFLGHPFVETPNMDTLAREGVHLANAFLTTSLCSPSRASILTGLCMPNQVNNVTNKHVWSVPTIS